MSVAGLAAASAHVQPLWAQLRLADRARYLRRAAQAVVDELDELAVALAGAGDREAAEVVALELLPGIDGLHWLSEHGTRALDERRVGAPRGVFPVTRGRVIHEPLGVVAVTGRAGAPFALPLWQAGAALLAGNGVVVVPGAGGDAAVGVERLARLFARASLPEGLLAVAAAGAPVAPGEVDATFPAPAGGAGALVLEDAGPGRAGRGLANAAFAVGGRAPGAAKRAWIAAAVHGAVVGEAVAAAAGYPAVAGGAEEATALVEAAVAAGATLRCGGAGAGGGFAPAVVDGVTEAMELARARPPAPVLAVTAVPDAAAAIAAANAGGRWTGGSVWTASRYEGARVARELRAGPTWLNDHHVVPALPAVPWGPGVGGDEGVRAYAQARALTWEPAAGAALWWGPYDGAVARAARAVVRLHSARDRDRERALRDLLPMGRVASRALRGRGR